MNRVREVQAAKGAMQPSEAGRGAGTGSPGRGAVLEPPQQAVCRPEPSPGASAPACLAPCVQHAGYKRVLNYIKKCEEQEVSWLPCLP